MISLEINIEELRKNKNFEEVAELTEQYLDEVQKFEDITQGELIRIMAEKLEEAGYPIREIREKIDERMHGKVTRQYISQQLDDRFKNPKKVAAGKATREAHKQQTNVGAASSSTVLMVEPELGDTESDVGDSDYLDRKNEGDDGDNDGEEEKLCANTDKLKPFTVKIPKMDTATLNRLYSASLASRSSIHLVIDPATNTVMEAYSDVYYEKNMMGGSQ